jgi:hypothetical protein
MSAVRRITVALPDYLHKHLREEATRRRMTISGLAREAIEAYLGSGRRRRLLAAGTGRSGRSDISERIEEILRTESERGAEPAWGNRR